MQGAPGRKKKRKMTFFLGKSVCVGLECVRDMPSIGGSPASLTTQAEGLHYGNTSSVLFYSSYWFLGYVSEYKAVAWLFSITPFTGQLPHDIHEKKSIKNRKQLIEIPNAWTQWLLRFRKAMFLSLIKHGCTYMESQPERFVGFITVS
jgi:hypothetical protein